MRIAGSTIAAASRRRNDSPSLQPVCNFPGRFFPKAASFIFSAHGPWWPCTAASSRALLLREFCVDDGTKRDFSASDHRKILMIHLSCHDAVASYRLSAKTQGTFSPRVAAFLTQAADYFVKLESLGEIYSSSGFRLRSRGWPNAFSLRVFSASRYQTRFISRVRYTINRL